MKKQSFKQWFFNKLKLPNDVTLDVPRITLIGQLHIYIENHKGLVHFSNEEVRLKRNDGEILMRGEHFTIKTILPEELLLEGKINQIEFIPPK